MLSEATRRELQGELDRLRDRAEALEKILNESHMPGRPSVSMSTSPNGSLAGMGLREAARKVLESFPRGLKPLGVAAQMEVRGFQSDTEAKTPLVTRIRNELWRMGKKGELESNRGVYRVRRR